MASLKENICALQVHGVNIKLKDKFKAKLTWRKSYNLGLFNDAYQHQIANHYRDYKLRPTISALQRRRRRQWQNRRRQQQQQQQQQQYHYEMLKKQLALNDMQQIQKQNNTQTLTIQDFPRLVKYGDNKYRCDLTEQTNNHTIQRIRKANNLQQFQVLVEKHLNLFQRNEQRSKTIDKYQQNQLNQQFESDYIDIAYEYHEEVVLNNRNYLQQIGVHNENKLLKAIRDEYIKETEQFKQQNTIVNEQQDNFCNEFVLNEKQEINELNNTLYTLSKRKFYNFTKLAKLIKRIANEQTVLHADKQQQYECDSLDENSLNHNWQIKINITPAKATIKQTNICDNPTNGKLKQSETELLEQYDKSIRIQNHLNHLNRSNEYELQTNCSLNDSFLSIRSYKLTTNCNNRPNSTAIDSYNCMNNKRITISKKNDDDDDDDDNEVLVENLQKLEIFE